MTTAAAREVDYMSPLGADERSQLPMPDDVLSYVAGYRWVGMKPLNRTLASLTVSEQGFCNASALSWKSTHRWDTI